MSCPIIVDPILLLQSLLPFWFLMASVNAIKILHRKRSDKLTGRKLAKLTPVSIYVPQMPLVQASSKPEKNEIEYNFLVDIKIVGERFDKGHLVK